MMKTYFPSSVVMKNSSRRWIPTALVLAAAAGVIMLLWPVWKYGTPPAELVDTALAAPADDGSSTASFAVRYRGVETAYRPSPAFIMPGDTLQVERASGSVGRALAMEAERGQVLRAGPGAWRWVAPGETGLHRLTLRDEGSGRTLILHAFVLTPFDHRREVLNGFRVGRYEFKPLRNDPAYIRPRGFIEVTRENQDALVSPHFRLGQFLAKQEGDYPKYLILQEKLLLKLEAILEAVRKAGHEAQTLHVMSGFRTPYYNRLIGNETSYSRHLYGDAADIFVDADGDEMMDDLDGDGAITLDDARYLARLVEDLSDETWFEPLEGGLGIYPANSEHGPFIHVDTRGKKARW